MNARNPHLASPTPTPGLRAARGPARSLPAAAGALLAGALLVAPPSAGASVAAAPIEGSRAISPAGQARPGPVARVRDPGPQDRGPKGPGPANPGRPLAFVPNPIPEGMDPIEFLLLPPELVMRHQGEIQLRPEQRQAIIAELQQTQADLVPLEFDLNDAQQKLVELLDRSRVDEEQALAVAGRLTEMEGEIKHRHLTLLIHIKNLLDEDQQQRLREIRQRDRAREFAARPGVGR